VKRENEDEEEKDDLKKVTGPSRNNCFVGMWRGWMPHPYQRVCTIHKNLLVTIFHILIQKIIFVNLLKLFN
jgi:hypothetical protein